MKGEYKRAIRKTPDGVLVTLHYLDHSGQRRVKVFEGVSNEDTAKAVESFLKNEGLLESRLVE